MPVNDDLYSNCRATQKWRLRLIQLRANRSEKNVLAVLAIQFKKRPNKSILGLRVLLVSTTSLF